MAKRILILTPRFPYPLIGGDKLRIHSIAQGLKEAGFELALLSFVTDRREAELARQAEITAVFHSVQTVLLPKWRSYFNVLAALPGKRPLQTLYYHSRKMEAAVRAELSTGAYNAVLAHLIRMAPYAIGHEYGQKGITKILEMTDALSLNYMRSREQGSRGMLGKIYRIEEGRARDYEGECVRRFDRTVVVSPVDRDYLLKRVGAAAARKIAVVAHGMPDSMLETKPQPEDPNLMVFTGNMRTHQNNDAILHFVRDIYPLVRARRPGAILRIVGMSPSREVRALDGRMGIQVTGKVERVADHVAAACVSICPMRIGAGMRGKILGSMAMSIPVVTTAVGAEGIEGAVSDEHLVFADTPADFAAAVLRVMGDADLRAKLRVNGKRLVEERYRYGALGREYAELLKNLPGLSS
jgi:glycosyltransferase involved in cell wall biosynthesis